VVCAVLAEPIVRIVYQRGDFTAVADHVVAACLAAFSLGLAFNGADADAEPRLLLDAGGVGSRPGSRSEPRAECGARRAFYKLGIWGIPLSTSLVNIAGTSRS
jgi:hypothetical protein